MHNNHLLDALTREGVLITVSVRYWRAAKKLQATDLGLDPDDGVERMISRGHERLLPTRDAPAVFALVKSRANDLMAAFIRRTAADAVRAWSVQALPSGAAPAASPSPPFSTASSSLFRIGPVSTAPSDASSVATSLQWQFPLQNIASEPGVALAAFHSAIVCT